MHIGLIGGIGPAATDYYYQRIIKAFLKAGKELDLTTVHASSATLLPNLAANNVEDQLAIYDRLTKRLQSAGADCVVVTSIAGHFCIDEFKQVSPLTVIDMIEETDKAVAAKGFGKIGILGTKTVMETRFYGGVSAAEVMPPQGAQLDAVHNAYVSMASAGSVNDEQRQVFAEACGSLLQSGAEAIMLGGTDLALVYAEDHSEFPVIDCAAIHCDVVVSKALNE